MRARALHGPVVHLLVQFKGEHPRIPPVAQRRLRLAQLRKKKQPARGERLSERDAVGALPAEEQEAFSLIFYHGHTRGQAALLIGVSERTVYRLWAAACLLLTERLGGDLPPV